MSDGWIHKWISAIWDLFPQNETQVAKFHFKGLSRFMMSRLVSFKMIYNIPGLLPYLGSKPIISLRNSFVFYWFLKCSMSHISFNSLVTCRLFCENRSHIHFPSKSLHKGELNCTNPLNIYVVNLVPLKDTSITGTNFKWISTMFISIWNPYTKELNWADPFDICTPSEWLIIVII